jgi:hypothetical protein
MIVRRVLGVVGPGSPPDATDLEIVIEPSPNPGTVQPNIFGKRNRRVPKRAVDVN